MRRAGVHWPLVRLLRGALAGTEGGAAGGKALGRVPAPPSFGWAPPPLSPAAARLFLAPSCHFVPLLSSPLPALLRPAASLPATSSCSSWDTPGSGAASWQQQQRALSTNPAPGRSAAEAAPFAAAAATAAAELAAAAGAAPAPAAAAQEDRKGAFGLVRDEIEAVTERLRRDIFTEIPALERAAEYFFQVCGGEGWGGREEAGMRALAGGRAAGRGPRCLLPRRAHPNQPNPACRRRARRASACALACCC